jgi:nucleotidyltransferase substrate binding protein (TIGR01987 family)
MDRFRERLTIAERTQGRFAELADRALGSEIERDAAIQRFEFCFEATWKAAQAYLRASEGVEVGSPKAAIRSSLEVGLLSEPDSRLALAMTDDRNLTVHTYNEELARRIAAELGGYAALLGRWIEAMRRQ